jgi:hypothetical protein
VRPIVARFARSKGRTPFHPCSCLAAAWVVMLGACGASPDATQEPAKAPPAAPVAARPAAATPPVAAPPAPTAPPAAPTTTAANAAPPTAVPEASVKPLLREGERVAHAPFSAGLGTLSRTTLVVVEQGGRLGAFTVGDDGKRTDGPALTTEWQLFEVPAVMFLQADGASGPDAVVLASCMTGIGPEGAVPFPCNAALTFTDKLERLPEVEARIRKATKAAEVKAALAAR